MRKLAWPTIFCNSLVVSDDGFITDYKMRIDNSKLSTIRALFSIGFRTIAAGDSYNDLDMLRYADAGFLFRSTDRIKADHPELPAYETYDELLSAIKKQL